MSNKPPFYEFGIGAFNDVAWLGNAAFLIARIGDPRLDGSVDIYRIVLGGEPELVFQKALPSGSPAFPAITTIDDRVPFAYHDGTTLWLRMLGQGQAYDYQGFGNSPCCFGGPWFAWQATPAYNVNRLDLRTGEVAENVRTGAPTGLSRILTDGNVVTVDEDRFSFPGATIPDYAGDLVVGEGPNGGTAWKFGREGGLLWKGLDCFTPKDAMSGNLVAISTHGPNVRCFVGTLEQLRSAITPDPPKPEDPKPEDPKPEVPVSDPLVETDLDRLILGTLNEVRPKYPTPLPTDRTEAAKTKGAILNEAAWLVSQKGFKVGLETKGGDNVAIQPRTGITVGNDIIQTVENGVCCGRDFLGSTDPGEAATPGLGRKGLADISRFVPPIQPVPPFVDPPDLPDPDVPEIPIDAVTHAELNALKADVAVLKTFAEGTEAAQKATAEKLAAIVDNPPIGSLPDGWEHSYGVRFKVFGQTYTAPLVKLANSRGKVSLEGDVDLGVVITKALGGER